MKRQTERNDTTMRIATPLTIFCLLPALLTAQEGPDSAQAALMAELAQPGPEHQRLAALAGTWDVEVRAPGAGDAALARATNTVILGGRFLTSEVSGAVGGVPFESLTIIGFDRGPGVYTAVGFDTFGTFYVTAAGPWDDDENRAVLRGSYADPMTGHAHEYEFVLTIHSPDHFTWAVVFVEGGNRQTVIELDSRRASS